MDKNIPLHLQEIIFSSSDSAVSRTISKLQRNGEVKKIAPRIYTSNLQEDAAAIVKRNIFKIIGHLYPGIRLSHRSALEYKPTATGDLFLTYTHDRKITLPGITINMMKGPGAIPGDYLLTEGLYVSQQERAMLENFQESRKPGAKSKTLTLPEIEERLDQIVRINGEEGLNKFRDKARQLAKDVGLEKEFKKLNQMTSALLTTNPSDILSSSVAMARAFGRPYDPQRIALFEKLYAELQQLEFSDIIENNTTPRSFRNFAFFEAYFSNFIEGTRFSVEEAKYIIDTGKPLALRDEDSHDILGTYQIVSNPVEMTVTPADPEHLLQILQYRHKIMLSARQFKNPGEFKDKNNRAGDTEFVNYSLVGGTLIQGFDFYQALQHPFAKAAYIMFLISEVHPFLDGNGRLARVMMNAELVKAGHTKIMIPTVFREDYLGGLRQLTRRDETGTYIRMLQRAQLFSASISGEDTEAMLQQLTQSNAFKEGNDHILKIIG